MMNHDQNLATFCAVFQEHGLDAAIDAISLAPEFNAREQADTLIEAACFDYGITKKDLYRGDRLLSEARHVVMWLLWATGMSYPGVGTALNGMNHASVIHGVKHVQKSHHLLHRAGCILARAKSEYVLSIRAQVIEASKGDSEGTRP